MPYLHVGTDKAASMAGIDLEAAKVADFGTKENIISERATAAQ